MSPIVAPVAGCDDVGAAVAPTVTRRWPDRQAPPSRCGRGRRAQHAIAARHAYHRHVFKLIVTLHVLAAVLLIGPFALAAFLGHRAIRRHDAGQTRDAARIMARFGIGSLLVALLGIGALASSDRYTFRTPWVIISLTLYVVAMGLATGYTVPAMRKAAGLIEQGMPGGQPDGGEPGTDAPAGSADALVRQRLDGVAGRIAGSGGLVLLLIVLITILMVTRPFGR
jgi:uncharacterized membrane protein